MAGKRLSRPLESDWLNGSVDASPCFTRLSAPSEPSPRRNVNPFGTSFNLSSIVRPVTCPRTVATGATNVNQVEISRAQAVSFFILCVDGEVCPDHLSPSFRCGDRSNNDVSAATFLLSERTMGQNL